MDLETVQKVNDVQRAVDQYKRTNGDQLPKENEVYPDVYEVDLSKTDVPSMKLTSVYSGEEMRFIMDMDGLVYVDYGYDIMQAIEKSNHKPQDDEDLREYLVNNSYFVPVKSLPYIWANGTPMVSNK
ncbi:hypothetical protein D3C76_1085150 [compost metagenome]